MRLPDEENPLGSAQRAGPSTGNTMEMRQTSTATVVDPALIRPSVYYNDGPFEPPSSSDEEGESLLDDGDKDAPDSPGLAELGLGSARSNRSFRTVDGREAAKSSSSSALRWLIIGLVSLVLLAFGIGFLAAVTYTSPSANAGLKKITMDHVFNGTFSVESTTLHWVPEAGDGVFSVSTGTAINLVDLKSNTTKTLVNLADIKDEHGKTLGIWSWQVSPDMAHILIKTDRRKQWRHSSYGNYYVHTIATKQTWPIVPPTNPSRTAYATWSPTGESIAYVIDNDLYVLPSATSSDRAIRITNSGNSSLFHGVPDWAYEEEIFSADFALWWSPDSNKLAFLSFDETSVPEFTFPIYNPTEDASTVVPYTSDVVMKYPKPGFPNPLVSVHVFDLKRYLDNHDLDKDGNPFNGNSNALPPLPNPEETLTLDWEQRHPDSDSIIQEVTWVADASLIVKEVNRNADNGNVVLFDLESSTVRQRANGRVVRKLGKTGEEGDDGWIDHEQTVLHLPGYPAYLDIVPNKEGYNHIALFSPINSDEPKFLTTGPWEVTGTIKSVDLEKGLVYFIAAKSSQVSSIERHVYSVPLPIKDLRAKIISEAEPKALTDASVHGYHAASFSPKAGFYVLGYQGPGIPWQKVVKVGDDAFVYPLTDNERLKNATLEYEAPIVSYSTIVSEGYELNVKEIRPPHMDDSGRTMYPVLFQVYGGPFSQMVDVRFSRSAWSNYVACGLKYIVVQVDGRGTGYRGRKLRNPVKGNLGFFETRDQIEAAKVWAKKSYVDPKRIGIWGWSYGGFMSAKVVEAAAGVHSLAMSVAPVTSWQFYDSIYTERYMNLPAINPGGYVNASISNVTNFNNVNYLLAHGSGDDNVHYSNTAHLLDMFTQQRIRNFRFRMFTDSDHSINRRGGQREVYEYLTAFINEKWGKGPKKRGSF